MYDYEHVMEGLEKYINREILPQIDGWKKWVAGTGIELALQNSKKIAEQLENNPVVKMLDIVDDKHNFDIEKLYHAMKRQAKETATIELPMVGTLRLDPSDVDKLYQMIIE